MRPSKEARYVARVTLAKGKSYEFNVPEEFHASIPDEVDLEDQFPLALGIIGDAAAEIVDAAISHEPQASKVITNDIHFSARVLQAFVESRSNPTVSSDLLLICSAGHYLANRPGDSLVAARNAIGELSPMAIALKWMLESPWNELIPMVLDEIPLVKQLLVAVAQHFQDGEITSIKRYIRELRWWLYSAATPHEMLMGELLSAAALLRIERSAWTLLPKFSGLSAELWTSYLRKKNAVQEMWPSQNIIGVAGVYSGSSAVVQMPTSAGKSRATELIIRSAFLADRTKLALVVAPFRALCQEITVSLRESLEPDGYRVNQLSDSMQNDFSDFFSEFLDEEQKVTSRVVILTPEKLLYLVRQNPNVMEEVKLVVYDEGHQFDSGSRGITYELLLTSIKRSLPKDSQTILISAVIRNAIPLANWLLGSKESVVSNSNFQTERSIAFASWPAPHLGFGRARFLKQENGIGQFSVPAVIQGERLHLKGKETKERRFPERTSGSIALYLALRLLSNGAAAIYCSTKASAAKIVRDAVTEVFGRGTTMTSPATHSDQREIERMEHLYFQNFGGESFLTQGAKLGIFAHHANTPNGIRLAIEHGMRKGFLRLVVCTSTLAQGVNLPIRYLLVTTTMQGGDDISARDFHNLMGRAGRAGMHGEGTVMFTNPNLFDDRLQHTSGGDLRWGEVNEILQFDSPEPIGSSLLDILEPIVSKKKKSLRAPSAMEILERLIDNPVELKENFKKISKSQKANGFSTNLIIQELAKKENALASIESFLMAYRGDVDAEIFYETSRELAASTFAYSLGDVKDKENLIILFEKLAKKIENLVPNKLNQSRYGRTLLGVDISIKIDAWVQDNIFLLELVDSDEEILEILWSLLVSLSKEKRLTDTEPAASLKDLAFSWISGSSYLNLANVLSESTFPHGEDRRKFTGEMVIELCERVFGFQFSHLVGGIYEAVNSSAVSDLRKSDLQVIFHRLQKRLRYGLPNLSAIAFYEVGLSDRVIAQEVSQLFNTMEVKFQNQAKAILLADRNKVKTLLGDYPDYFQSVLDSLS